MNRVEDGVLIFIARARVRAREGVALCTGRQYVPLRFRLTKNFGHNFASFATLIKITLTTPSSPDFPKAATPSSLTILYARRSRTFQGTAHLPLRRYGKSKAHDSKSSFVRDQNALRDHGTIHTVRWAEGGQKRASCVCSGGLTARFAEGSTPLQAKGTNWPKNHLVQNLLWIHCALLRSRSKTVQPNPHCKRKTIISPRVPTLSGLDTNYSNHTSQHRRNYSRVPHGATLSMPAKKPFARR